jgi:nicotinamidase/pyrazinamidase
MNLNDNDALLIVDVQYDFLPGGALAVPDGDAVVPVLAGLAATFRAASLPVIASRDWHPPDHCSFEPQGGPWPPHCVAGTPGAALARDLQLPDDAKIVDKAVTAEKDAYSAFEGTGLADWLRGQGVGRLFIGGLATEYCVLNTAADALANGFDVVLIEDAIRAIDDADGQRAIDSLLEKHASMASSGNVPDA